MSIPFRFCFAGVYTITPDGEGPEMPNFDLNGANVFATPVFNATIPKEGPKALPFTFNFGSDANAANEWELDLTLILTQFRMTCFQSMYLDTSNIDQQTSVTIEGIPQTIKLGTNQNGYFPILCPNPTRLLITNFSTQSGVFVNLILINVPMPANTWFVT